MLFQPQRDLQHLKKTMLIMYEVWQKSNENEFLFTIPV
jgi:hypothetical protein